MIHIPLTKDQVAIIDDDSFDIIGGEDGWYALKRATGDYHAARNRGVFVYMHHLILPKKEGFQVDHINGHGLDNQRQNLRCVTKQQNQYNRTRTCGISKYKGVSNISGCKTWRAYICPNNKARHLGCFKTQEDAARAYDRAALELFGDFARTNFPREDYTNALPIAA